MAPAAKVHVSVFVNAISIVPGSRALISFV